MTMPAYRRRGGRWLCRRRSRGGVGRSRGACPPQAAADAWPRRRSI